MPNRQTPKTTQTPDFRTMDLLIADLLDYLDAGPGIPERVTGVPTGLADFDAMTAGLHAGCLTVVAALPNMGKTALAITVAKHVSQVEGLPVAFFSLEATAPQLTARMLSAMGRIDFDHLFTGAFTKDEWHQLAEVTEQLRTQHLYIDDSPQLSAGELRAKARRLAHHCGQLGLIVVDYLQLVGRTPSGSRAATNAMLARDLRRLAWELRCPVIALSELAPLTNPRADPRPTLSDLGDSSALLPYADLFTFLHRDMSDTKGNDSTTVAAELIIARQRLGPNGTVHLAFQPQYSRFETQASQKSPLPGAPCDK